MAYDGHVTITKSDSDQQRQLSLRSKDALHLHSLETEEGFK